jgi:hypothetical protein
MHLYNVDVIDNEHIYNKRKQNYPFHGHHKYPIETLNNLSDKYLINEIIDNDIQNNIRKYVRKSIDLLPLKKYGSIYEICLEILKNKKTHVYATAKQIMEIEKELCIKFPYFNLYEKISYHYLDNDKDNGILLTEKDLYFEADIIKFVFDDNQGVKNIRYSFEVTLKENNYEQ